MSNSPANSPSPATSLLQRLRRNLVFTIPASFMAGYLVAVTVVNNLLVVDNGFGRTLRYPSWVVNLIGFSLLFGCVAAVHPQQTATLARWIAGRVRRFSLRTIMLAFTLCAVASSTLGVYLFRRETQRQVIKQFNVSAVWKDGQVDLLMFNVPKTSDNQRIDDKLDTLKTLKALRVLEMRYVKVSDKGLAVLPKLENLEELHLGHAFHFPEDADLVKVFMGTHFRGVDVTTEAGRKAVQASLDSRLQLIRALEITDDGMVHVGKARKLRKLVLQNTAISDVGIDSLSELNDLEFLDIRMTYVTNDGIRSLVQLPKLRELDLRNMRFVGDAAMEHCGKMRELRRLRLPPMVTDKGLRHLETLGKLDYLDLAQCQVTEAGVEKLRQSLPRCEIVRK